MPSRPPAHQRPGPALQTGQTLYFAYGSNLSFEQMAKRCPHSRFVGRARLYKYQFQINERGYANVIKVRDPNAFVDGLCYRLTPADEHALDRAEGVPTAYSKKELDVDFFPASAALIGRDVTDLVRHPVFPRTPSPSSSPSSSPEHVVDLASEPKILGALEPALSHAQMRGEPTRAMVYLSTKFVKPDLPWEEYITRMEMGLRQALWLGISYEYVEGEVRPLLKSGRGNRKVVYVPVNGPPPVIYVPTTGHAKRHTRGSGRVGWRAGPKSSSKRETEEKGRGRNGGSSRWGFSFGH